MTALEFWTWFQRNNASYLFLNSVDSDEKERLLDNFLSNLHQYSDKLFFEIGGHFDQDQDLIITAEGNSEYFAQVEILVNAAPEIKDWRIIAFKPPMGFEFKIEYKAREFDPDKIWFLPLESKTHPTEFGMRIGLANFVEESKQDFLGGVYLLVDSGLGEKRAAMDINYLDVGPLPEEPENEGFMKLTELSEFIDRWKKKASAGN